MGKILTVFSLRFFCVAQLLGNPIHVNNPDTVWIQTSAQCEMCKETIEKALAYEKGVIFSDLDLKTKKVKVVYNSSKTTPEKIRRAIVLSGYDADELPADSKAYRRLPKCCKKPHDR